MHLYIWSFVCRKMRGERNIEIIWAQFRACGLYHIQISESEREMRNGIRFEMTMYLRHAYGVRMCPFALS